MYKIFLTLFKKSYSIPLASRFSSFLPFLIFISFFLLVLFFLTFLFYYFPFLVVDLASSREEVSEYIYQSIRDDSDSPLTGNQGIDPVSVEPDSTLPSPWEDFSEISVSDGYEQDDEDYKAFPDVHPGNHPPFLGEKGQLPCIENNDHWEDHNPEEILADKSNFPEPPVPAPTSTPSSSSPVRTTSTQGFFSSLFTKVSQLFSFSYLKS